MGGYVAAIRAVQLGKSVALIEKDKLGGTCLHTGCIPTKALLHTAELYHDAQNSATTGVRVSGVELDWAAANARKQKIVDQLHKGVQYLMKKNKIEVLNGTGMFESSTTIRVDGPDGSRTIQAGNVVLATGSVPKSLPGVEIDGKRVINSDHALQLTAVPKSAVIVGAGAIGVEFASMWHDCGAEVTLVEALPRVTPLEDPEVSQAIARSFTKRGIKVIAGARMDLKSVKSSATAVAMKYESDEGGGELKSDVLLMAVGRAATTEGFGLEKTGVRVERGFVKVDADLRTDDPAIFAIGDVVGGYLLAHVASHEGIHAVEVIAGESPQLQPDAPLHLLAAPGRQRGPDRGAGAGGRRRGQGGQVPVLGAGPRHDQRRHRGLRQGCGRRRHRRDPGHPHGGPQRHRPGRRAHPGHAARGHGLGAGDQRARPSVAVRGRRRGGPGRGRPRDPRLTTEAPTMKLVKAAPVEGIEPATLRQMYRAMLLARMVDERCWLLNRGGKAPFVISCQGQEGAQVGSVFALDRTQDWFAPYYRDLAVVLALGETARDILLSVMGKAGDPNSGARQMPSHFGSRRLRIISQGSSVGTQALHAVGTALASKSRGESAVSISYVGEGGTSQGDFHEAMNFASVHRLPVIFLVENNSYAISVPQSLQMAIGDVADRAAGYGMPGVVVDGQDVLEVYRVTREAADRARAGEGPTLIEAKTHRFTSHSSDDDQRVYRPEEELRQEAAEDCLPRFLDHLRAAGAMGAADDIKLRAELLADIDAATEAAENAPYPAPEDALLHVYGTEPPTLDDLRGEPRVSWEFDG